MWVPGQPNDVTGDVSLAGTAKHQDRLCERLGHSDTGVIMIRKLWRRELRALAEDKPLKRWSYAPDSLHTETWRDKDAGY